MCDVVVEPQKLNQKGMPDKVRSRMSNHYKHITGIVSMSVGGLSRFIITLILCQLYEKDQTCMDRILRLRLDLMCNLSSRHERYERDKGMGGGKGGREGKIVNTDEGLEMKTHRIYKGVKQRRKRNHRWKR